MEAHCVTPDVGPAADGLMLTLRVMLVCRSKEIWVIVRFFPEYSVAIDLKSVSAFLVTITYQ